MDDKETLARSRARRGEVIGSKYVLDEVLGIGGMGVVHVALQRSLERTVAIKVPRPELADDPVVRYLLHKEAVTSSRISHRNIVATLDFGDEAGVPYMVMEHVVGPRLGQLLHDAGALPLVGALDIVRQIVAALEDAHGNGIVHADVKCDNVLVQTQRDGTVVPRLIDFGIARFVDERLPAPTHDTFVTGTPEYVAPEVARGERPTPAADVYAIGVMLYELVTGVAPFNGANAGAIMSRKVEIDAVRMSRRRPELAIPGEIDALVARMLARNPLDRPSDARELARCLDAAQRIPPRAESAIFSTEALTASVEPVKARLTRPSLAEHRVRVIASIKDGDVDRIAVAYLELARVLVDRRELASAQTELEEGVELLMTPGARGPAWRLLLSLAALYEHRGDRVKARLAARAARDQANEIGSTIGRARSERLCARLR
jgi:serine/threonine-protein kinase